MFLVVLSEPSLLRILSLSLPSRFLLSRGGRIAERLPAGSAGCQLLHFPYGMRLVPRLIGVLCDEMRSYMGSA